MPFNGGGAGGGGGGVSRVNVTNPSSSGLLTMGVTNPTTTPTVAVDMAAISAYSTYGNNTASSAVPTVAQYLVLGTPGFTPAANTSALQITNTVASYFQLALQNLSSNASASTDLVVTANDGDDSTHYGNLGINGSAGGSAPFTGAHAFYLYSTDAELDLGALGTSGVTKIYTGGGLATPTLAATFSATNLTVVGTVAGSNLSGTNTGDQNLAPYATIASPTFTGTPAAPTAGPGTNTTQLATTAFVLANAGGGSSAFSALTSSTNTTAAMVVGSGATLGVSGTGTITATGAAAFAITGAVTNTSSPAVSTYAYSWTGTLQTGGTGTTNFPALFLGNGGTAVTSWSVNGSYIGINALTGFSGRFLDFYTNNVTAFSVNSSGTITSAGGIACSGATATFSVAGTSVTAAVNISGAWKVSSAASNAQVLIQDSGAAAYSIGNTGGNGLVVNGPSGLGNGLLLDLSVNNASKFNVNGNGIVTATNTITSGAGIAAGSGNTISWTSRSKLSSPADGKILLQNAAATAFTLLQFGGTSSSFPSLKVSSANLQCRLADDSAFAVIQGKLTTDTAATTGLSAGVLAATTNASLVIYDSTGQAYRVPCII